MKIQLSDLINNKEMIRQHLQTNGNFVMIELPKSDDVLYIERDNMHFAGYMPADLYNITYLQDDGEEWQCNNSEYAPADQFELAWAALKLRSIDPFNITSYAVPIDQFLIAE